MGKSNIRKPAVAGQFYPGTAQELNARLKKFIDPQAEQKRVIGCMLPHAGYIYSGAVAGATVSRVEVPEKVILLGPNHTGYGTALSVMNAGAWQTPLGEVPIDAKLADELLGASELLQADELAHAYEHSLEVELPFLQFRRKDFSIVPIAIAAPELTALKAVGKAIGKTTARKNLKGSVLMVASSDMSHYEPQEKAEQKDRLAIEAILALDEDALFSRIREYDITMCGYMPVAVMLSAAKELGATKAELVRYQTSGDASGDYSSVVGYAGIIVY